MELRDQRLKPTLARKLGEVTHVSPLLRKVCDLSGLPEERVGEWLLKCAVGRGASHYEREFSVELPPDNPKLSHEELGIALCLGNLTWNGAYIRAAGQLLSASDIEPTKLALLAKMERVEPVLLHIADAAERVDSNQQPWAWLRMHLKTRQKINPAALPHWSRFVSQSGVTAFGGGPRIDWLQRVAPTR